MSTPADDFYQSEYAHRYHTDANFHALVHTFAQLYFDGNVEEALEEVGELVQECEWRIEDRRPVYGCRDITAKRSSASLSGFDAILRQTYGPAMREHIAMHNNILQVIYPDGPPKRTRRQKARSWLRRHRPRIVWGY